MTGEVKIIWVGGYPRVEGVNVPEGVFREEGAAIADPPDNRVEAKFEDRDVGTEAATVVVYAAQKTEAL